MASEPETEPNTEPPQLQLTSLLNLKPLQYPHSCTITPLHTSASVPFSWEQEPGKPLPCLTLALPSSHHTLIKCLELPPRLLNENKFTKTPSPTTVLEGPYSLGRSILGSSSFRFLRKRRKSFDGEVSFGGSGGSSPEKGLLDRGLFGSWRKKGGEVCEGSLVFSSLSDDVCGGCCNGGATVMVGRVHRKRGQLGRFKSPFWAAIYGTFKQVIPRRRTK